MIFQVREGQNQVVMKPKIEIYTEACYIAMKIGRKWS